MPLSKEATLRYHIIDECIRNKYNPTRCDSALEKRWEDRLGKKFTNINHTERYQSHEGRRGIGYLAPLRFSRQEMGLYYTDSRTQLTLRKVLCIMTKLMPLNCRINYQQYRKQLNQRYIQHGVDKVLTSLKAKRHSEDGMNTNIIFPEKSQGFQRRWAKLISLFIAYAKRIPVLIAFSLIISLWTAASTVILFIRLFSERAPAINGIW